MKRSIKCFIKYVLLVVCTAFITTVVFNIVRKLQKYEDRHVLGHALLLQNDLIGFNDTHTELADKIDWHDYAFIEAEKLRTGIGEQGKSAELPVNYSKKKYDDLYSTNGFNALLSDYISINRSVADIRHTDCKNMKYRRKLPTVSVIVPFHNEHWSTLLRTAYSVLNRSPEKLLKEVILVDDYSSKAHAKEELDNFVKKNLPKVKVLHLTKREGLIRARLAGARRAKGDVLIFLDSHSEANINWLPPLLDPIAEDYRTCVCPFIDVIAYETFEYRAQDEGARGAFDWEFFYKRLPLLPEDKLHPTQPFKSPVMAGGLFAISTKFFWELGGYDQGLYIWGGEQYELSFKIWQCGGRMLDAPCSRVGHIYRKFAPFPNPGIGDFVGKNYRRVAEVWMDEYAEYLYKRRPHYRSIDPGDLTEQRAIRNKLNCKPFKWFIQNVAFDLVKKYPPVEPLHYSAGKVKNYVATEYCVSWKNEKKSLFLEECGGDNLKQDFEMTYHKDVKCKGTALCWDVSKQGSNAPVNLFGCHGSQGNQLWKYDEEKLWLVHGNNPRCLDCNLRNKTLFVTDCDSNSETQKWVLENVNKDVFLQWHKDGL